MLTRGEGEDEDEDAYFQFHGSSFGGLLLQFCKCNCGSSVKHPPSSGNGKEKKVNAQRFSMAKLLLIADEQKHGKSNSFDLHPESRKGFRNGYAKLPTLQELFKEDSSHVEEEHDTEEKEEEEDEEEDDDDDDDEQEEEEEGEQIPYVEIWGNLDANIKGSNKSFRNSNESHSSFHTNIEGRRALAFGMLPLEGHKERADQMGQKKRSELQLQMLAQSGRHQAPSEGMNGGKQEIIRGIPMERLASTSVTPLDQGKASKYMLYSESKEDESFGNENLKGREYLMRGLQGSYENGAKLAKGMQRTCGNKNPLEGSVARGMQQPSRHLSRVLIQRAYANNNHKEGNQLSYRDEYIKEGTLARRLPRSCQHRNSREGSMTEGFLGSCYDEIPKYGFGSGLKGSYENGKPRKGNLARDLLQPCRNEDPKEGEYARGLLYSRSVREGGSSMQSNSYYVATPLKPPTILGRSINQDSPPLAPTNRLLHLHESETRKARRSSDLTYLGKIRQSSEEGSRMVQNGSEVQGHCRLSIDIGASSKGSQKSLLSFEDLKSVGTKFPMKMSRKRQTIGGDKELGYG